MAIHIDVLARLQDRQVAREADKMADYFDEAGREAGQRYGDGVAQGIVDRSPKVQKALNGVRDAADRVAVAQAAERKAAADLAAQEERLAIASEKVSAAKRREENATLAVMEAEYRLNQAVKAGNVDTEKMVLLEERVEAAKRNEENASLAVRAAIEDEHRARRDANAEAERMTSISQRVISARRKEADAHRAVGAAMRAAANDMRNTRSYVEELDDSIQQIGTNAFRLGRGLTTIGTGPVIIALFKLAQGATAASQSVLLLPAAAATAAAGIGTLSLATAGFADTIKDIRDPEKFAEGLALLGPNAQQAALSMQNLLPVFDQLKYATQDAFFAGIGEQIHRLTNEFMPEIQSMTTNIAGSFNLMMTNLANQLMTPTNIANINEIFGNISQTFQALVPGAQAFTQAMVDLTTVGSGYMPQLAGSISSIAQSFADFIAEAAASGDLNRWIEEGITALEGLISLTWQFGEILYQAFAPDNIEGVNQLIDDLYGINEVLGIITGNTDIMAQSWQEELDGMQGPAAALRDGIMNIPLALNIVAATFVQFANTAKDAFVNGPIKALNLLLKGFNAIPGKLRGMFGLPAGDLQIPEIPDIPNIPARNILENNMLPRAYDKPAGPFAQGGNQRGDQPKWTAPDGTRMEWDPAKGWVPVPGRQRTPFGNRQQGLGNYPGPFAVPAPPDKDAKGRKPSDRDRRDAIIASLDPSLYRVDPYGQVPGLPAVPGLLKPGDPRLYQAPGYQQDPQAVLEAQQDVERKAHDLEEARKERLALERDNEASAEQLNDARYKELKAGQDLQREQADLSEKLRGSTKKLKDRMGELGVALDPDLGLSKGLAGFAEFLTKFIGNMIAAPTLARLDAISQADPLQGGYGLMGIMGARNIAAGKSPILGRPLTAEEQAAYYSQGGSGGAKAPKYDTSTYPGFDPNSGQPLAAPTRLQDTGSTPSGPQSRTAAALVEQFFGGQLRGTIGGSRDTGTAPGTHDAGLSIDIPIGPDQMGLGDQIEQFLQANAAQLGLKYTIWRNQGKYPGGGGFDQSGHMDHIDAHFNGQGGVGGAFSSPASTGYGAYSSSASFAGGSIPLPLPVTIVGGGFGGPGAPGSAPRGGPTSAYSSQFGAGYANRATAAPAGSGAEAWRNTVASVVQQYGPAAGIAPQNYQAWIDAIVKQIDTESKGDPNADNPNDSNGQGGRQHVSGLLQYLPETYANSGGALTGRPYMDPIGQIAGALLAPRDANGLPSTTAPGSIGQGHGWGPSSTPSSLPSFGGGGSTLPGVGMPNAAPFGLPSGGPTDGATQIGGVGAPTGPGGGGPGGIGMTPGGTLDTALGVAAAGLDVLAPGAGQAAQMGIKLANRAIQYGGQLAAIGVSGLMETFLPTGGSDLANNSWLTRIAGGLAGAIPQVPNIAGGKSGTGVDKQGAQPPLDPSQVTQGGGAGVGAAAGNQISVQYNNNGATEDRAGRDLTHHLGNMYAGAAR